MKYRELGNTGIEVSQIGLGTWQLGGTADLGGKAIGWANVDDQSSLRTLERAYELGITLFDTADAYGRGHSEELIGKTFRGRRDKIVISSKFGNREMKDGSWGKDFSPSYLRTALEASLRRLNTDYIDLYHMHSPRDNSWMKEDTVAELEKLRGEGKIRAFGLSVKPPEAGDPEVQALEAMNAYPELSFFQIVYNILEQAPAQSFFPRAMEMQRGIIVRVPLASGFLSGKITRETRFPKKDNRHDRYPPERIESLAKLVDSLSFLHIPGKRSLAQAALQYVLAHPGITTVIPGARIPEQVEANAAALEAPGLTESEMKRISKILGEKKSYMKL